MRRNNRGSVLPLVLVVMVLAVTPVLALYTFHGREMETAVRYRDHEVCLTLLDSGLARCKSQIEQQQSYRGETLPLGRGKVTIQVNRLNAASWFFKCTATCGTARATQSGTITLKDGLAEITGETQ